MLETEKGGKERGRRRGRVGEEMETERGASRKIQRYDRRDYDGKSIQVLVEKQKNHDKKTYCSNMPNCVSVGVNRVKCHLH